MGKLKRLEKLVLQLQDKLDLHLKNNNLDGSLMVGSNGRVGAPRDFIDEPQTKLRVKSCGPCAFNYPKSNGCFSITNGAKCEDWRPISKTSETPEGNLKVGDWFVPHEPSTETSFWFPEMQAFNNKPLKISFFVRDGEERFIKAENCEYLFHPNWCEKWIPKRGEYFVTDKWICILKYKTEDNIYEAVSISKDSHKIYFNCLTPINYHISPASPEEIALLNSELAELNKQFDKEKCRIVEITDVPNMEIEKEVKTCRNCSFRNGNAVTEPCKTCGPNRKHWTEIVLIDKELSKKICGNCVNHPKPIDCDVCQHCKYNSKQKEPIVGQKAIAWNKHKKNAIIGIYKGAKFDPCIGSALYKHAILFESMQQYDIFISTPD